MNKKSFLAALALAYTVLYQSPAHSATLLGTAFTYQAQLKQAGQPVDGLTDFKFSLWTLVAGGSQVGGTITMLNVSVDNGLFTVTLDFGAAAFIGDPRWLQIEARHPAGGGVYALLTPRQAITAAPYSLHTRGLYVAADGKVGVQDSSPAAALTVGDGDKFQVSGTDGDLTFTDDQASITFPGTDGTNAPMLQMFATGTGNGDRMVFAHSPSFTNWGLQYQDSSDRFRYLSSGTQVMNIDLGAQTVSVGASSPGGRFGVITPSGVGIWAESAGGGLGGVSLRAHNTSASGIGIWSTTNSADANLVLTNTGSGDLIRGFSGGGGGNLLFRVLNNGTTVTTVLQITGGADLAEPFHVNAEEGTEEQRDRGAKIEPGMVVVIDPTQPGKLKPSRVPYDRKVAGVISGANGLSPGMVMSARNDPYADGEHPVALTGRVWCWCDATDGAIEPGDLLTTSERYGHAMKVTDFGRSQGAVLGKAMTDLKTGEQGLVLVLVGMQ